MNRDSGLRNAWTLILSAALAIPALAQTQVRRDVIHGRVTSDSGAAVGAAQIIATRAPDRAIFRATSDSGGRFVITVDSGTGDYLVHISWPARPTWTAVRRRITKQALADSVFEVNAVLKAPEAQQLSTVTVRTEKPRPERSAYGSFRTDEFASEQAVAGVYAALSPADRGNIQSAAGTLPGILSGASGFSVLGLPPDQNRTTLNGTSFGGSALPRDASHSISVASSAFDPSRGWFSGGEAVVSLSSGLLFSHRTASLTADAPMMQSGDALSRELGQQFSSFAAGTGGDGMALNDRIAYNYGVQASRRSAAVSTLADADGNVLRHAGVSRDSVLRLLSLLSGSGIPISDASFPNASISQNASLVARINTPTYDAKAMKPIDLSGGLIIYAAHAESGASTLAPLWTPSRFGVSSNDALALQGVFSGFLTPNLLQDVKLAVNVNSDRSTPYLAMPSGNVLVTSELLDGLGALSTLGFGGASGAMHSRSTTWEMQSETQFYAPGHPKHRFKVTADLRHDDLHRTTANNEYGSFRFNSLADFAAGRPAAFTRTLSSPARTASGWNGFLSLGDFFSVTPKLRLLYGARVEANRFDRRPQPNSAIEKTFDVRTDRVPNRAHVSPRVGFVWSYSKSPTGGGLMTNGWGVYPKVPSGVIRGGFGEFRSMIAPAILAEPSARTGLPGSSTSISCFGDVVPNPDWSNYLASAANIPRDCANGSAGLRDAAPRVQLVDRTYDAPRSWRGNLSWTAMLWKTTLTIEGSYSLNLNQTGKVDLNFANTPQFVLRDEGRPVFVPIASIVSATGVLSPAAARRSGSFGQVLSEVSDLRSEAHQVLASISFAERGWVGSVAYALQSIRDKQRGFDGATFGTPIAAGWSRSGLDVRHSLVFQGGHGWKWINLSVFGRLASGRPFTPVVAGDVNGDGLSNDRAFVFDPAHATDPDVATGMRALLTDGPSNVRSCLTKQLGRAAARNGCEGPWTVDLTARVGVNTFRLPAPWNNWSAELFISNPLNGLDQLLHGRNLRGWGNPSFADPTLLQVEGFDPAAQRFVYAVNPRFGDTRPSSSTLRAPFRVTFSVKITLGAPLSQQQLDRFLRPGRAGNPGTKLSVDELKKRYRRNVPDPYRELLAQTDSLLLTDTQVAALKASQAKFNVRVDSAWTELAKYLAELPDHFDAAAVLKEQEAALDQIWDMGRPEMKATLPAILTPLQLKLLPWVPRLLFSAKEPIRGIRMFVYGNP